MAGNVNDAAMCLHHCSEGDTCVRGEGGKARNRGDDRGKTKKARKRGDEEEGKNARIFKRTRP